MSLRYVNNRVNCATCVAMLHDELTQIEAVIGRHRHGVPVGAIAEEVEFAIPRRTLQYRLKQLVEGGRVAREGRGRRTLYRLRPHELHVSAETGPPRARVEVEAVPGTLAKQREELRGRYLSLPAERRTSVRYRQEFLDGYRPNTSSYLSFDDRDQLREMGQQNTAEEPAGTYARRILDRMLIDLAWNSSRLEGNTYSLLDTKRLIESGNAAADHDLRETQMILNHKHAIEFLVDAVDEIGFDGPTILNLHAILADNLLPDPAAPGRLRRMAVGIGVSAYRPLEVPSRVEECFDRLLIKARAIEDPFEQALFCLVQLPYLQAFDDVNKRVSRLAANMPFIKHNLSPLSFNDVPRDYYSDAVLLIYERNDIALMRDLFRWAYERSAARYGAVGQSLGEPDPFRLLHREELRGLVGEVVRDRLDVKLAAGRVAAWVDANVEAGDRDRFREIAETELIGLHEGNYARYRVTRSEFKAWRDVWDAGA